MANALKAQQELCAVMRKMMMAQSGVQTVLRELYDNNTEGENARLAYALQLATDVLDDAYNHLDELSVGRVRSQTKRAAA